MAKCACHARHRDLSYVIDVQSKVSLSGILFGMARIEEVVCVGTVTSDLQRMFFPRVLCRCHLRHEEFLYRSASAGGGRSRHSASKILDNLKAEYGKGVDEESVRFGNFKANVHIICEINAPNLTYTLCARVR